VTHIPAKGRTHPAGVDELAFAGRENLDPEHVARYDAKEDAGAAAEMATLGRMGIGTEATVVDIGAGTGQFTLAAAAAVRRVVAVDVSPVMLARLREKLDVDGAGNVETIEAGFLTYQHSGAPADLVYSRLALHHLPDFWKAVALARIAAMLRPGGIFRVSDVVFGFEPDAAGAALERWFATADSGDVEVAWTRAELEEHVFGEHSTFTWLLEPMLERAGLAIERAEYGEDGILAHYVCRRA
jgi:ubiquinone/menaquinone biosynthesis C-methylase UbiE